MPLKILFMRIAAINTDDVSLMLILTFPVWFALGIAFLAVSIVGFAIGIMVAILDVLIGLIGLPFELFPGRH
jgi:uncharacterized integral membrane protein